MDRNAILKYISDNNGTEIPALQKKFALGYAEALSVVNKLVEEGRLEYAEGVRYSFKEDKKLSPFEEFTKRRQKKSDEGGSDLAFMLGAEGEGGEASPGGITEKLKKDALEFAVDLGKISVSDLVVRFIITYFKANLLIRWMESMKYISGYIPDNAGKRDVYLTREEFDVLYGEEEDEDDEEDEEDAFSKVLKEMDAEISKREKRSIDERFKSVHNKLSAKSAPVHPSWEDDKEFDDAVTERMHKLIKSDINLGWQRAVKKAENYLDAVKDTSDTKMTELYERLVFELKAMGNYHYAQLKKHIFG